MRDAGEIRGVVSSGSLFVSRTASTSVLRCLFLGFLSLIAGLLQTGQVRFPSVSQGSTHLQWYALNKDKLPLVLNNVDKNRDVINDSSFQGKQQQL